MRRLLVGRLVKVPARWRLLGWGGVLKTSITPAARPVDVNLVELVAGLALTHDAPYPSEPLYLRAALAARGVEADYVKIWQTVASCGAGMAW